MDLVVAADRLAVQIASPCSRAWGMPDDHVTVTVDRILYADLRGIDSHGCTTLAFYQRLRADGVLNPERDGHRDSQGWRYHARGRRRWAWPRAGDFKESDGDRDRDRLRARHRSRRRP